MPSSAIIDLAIGLTFVFGVTAALSSMLTELIARLIGLRAAYLLTGLRELVDDPGKSVVLASAEADYATTRALITNPDGPKPTSVTGALLGSPILRSQGMVGHISTRNLTVKPAASSRGGLPEMAAKGRPGSTWRARRSLPAYISAQSFAEAVIDLVIPNAAGDTLMDTVETNIKRLPESALKRSLLTLAANAGNDLGRFRSAVERWYDDHMDRVSGWYKRYTAVITLVIGSLLVLLFNINTLTIARTLYTQSAVNQAVTTVATKAVNCPSGQSGQSCLTAMEAQLSSAATAGLPIGWGTVRDCRVPGVHCNWWARRGIISRHGSSFAQFLLVLAGFLITIIALVPGARFWFAALSKLGTLRSSGPKPAPASGS
jgi:hypothetical protein